MRRKFHIGKILTSLAVFAGFGLLQAGTANAKVPDFSGTWGYHNKDCRGEYVANFYFKQIGRKVTGDYSEGASFGRGGESGDLQGIIKGDKLFIKVCSNTEDNPEYNRPACRKKGGRSGQDYIAYFTRKGNKMTRYYATGEGLNRKYSKDVEVFYKAKKGGSFPINVEEECIN